MRLRFPVVARWPAVTLVLVALGVGVWAGAGGCSRGSAPPGTHETPGGSATATAQPRTTWAGSRPAPELPTGLDWLNVSRPLTLRELRGRAVLLDFWTLGCINCQHIIPDLERLEAEFGDRLLVIGVHSGKYATEHEVESVREAVRRLGIRHPVVNDPDFAAWQAYGVNAWPTLVLIDPAGNIVGGHAGEGVYALFQPILEALFAEFAGKDVPAPAPLPLAVDAAPVATVLHYPSDVAGDDAAGRIFIADAGHHRILEAGLDGTLRRVFGSGEADFVDGPADRAAFHEPQGIALSADGRTLYVADTRNHAVRAIDLERGEVRTLAGTGAQLTRLPTAGAMGRTTALASPWDVLEHGGRLFISMAGVHQVWTLDLETNAIGVFAGTSREGLEDGPRRAQATLAQPSGLASDGRYLYWVDPEASAVRRTLLAGDDASPVETLAGKGLFDYGNDDGDRETARFQHPQGIAFLAGTLYVGDTYNHRLRTIDPARFVSGTAAGTGERGRVDGPGPIAQFDEPAGLGVAAGRVYIADQNNHLVRVYDPAAGSVATLTLTNLAVLGPAPGGRTTRVELPRQEVAPGAGLLRIDVQAPAGHHLNSLAPSVVALATSDAAVLLPGESEVRFATDEAEFAVTLPAEFAPGEATLTATAQVYYCRTGEEALCFIRTVEYVLPVGVTAAGAGEALLAITLPPG